MMRIRNIALATAALLTAGCGDDGPRGPGGMSVDCSDEVTQVDVTVSTGEDVRFDWSPRCRVAYFGVEEVEGGDRWWIGDDETENRISPPITYGDFPEGFSGESALPLVEGESYEVILWIIGDDGEYLAAVETFVR